MTPQQRAKLLLESEGYMVDVVEQINRRRSTTWRKDLFGAFDLLAVNAEGDVKAIQVTDRTNVSHRVKKISALKSTMSRLRKANWGLFVYGYGETKTKGNWVIVEVTE